MHERLAAACAELAGLPVQRDEPMARHTTLGIGGPADALVTAADEASVTRVLAAAARHGVPLFVLGGGSNLLVGDGGIRGITLTLAGALAELVVLEEGRRIEVGAAASFPRLAQVALSQGWPPAVGWFGTPGQVGGALVMNAGTRQGEIGDVVSEVRLASADGTERRLRPACGFGYRTSAFPPGAVLTSAVLQCDSHKSSEVEALTVMAHEQLNRRRATQPKQRSAGSIFKNPPGDFAGRLVEAAGLKGYAVGGASISDVHANFIVNTGGAVARDVVAVAEHARTVVRDRFGVELEWEVRRVGEHQ
ncbi:MAG: UDP-N-acetylenolpyruvoylglucosamine reductase [Deltaproteobacteria bacterium RBG_16_71_12]|nr:MAG: UDP-N-acetylenolpyruvoylglucosamine reductase [Deltaproteobacteria bacterium RBG_16_71_12]